MRRAALLLLALVACSSESDDPALDTEAAGTDPTVADTTQTGTGTEGDPTSETEVGPSTETEFETTETEPSSTTGPACMGKEECDDPAAPFCVAGECAPCSQVQGVAPTEACRLNFPKTPVCAEGLCVPCSDENLGACDGDTPVCNANACVGCTYHDQCEALGMPACDIVSGACFTEDQVLNVDVDDDIGSNDPIQDAIDLVPAGGVRVLVLTGNSTPTVNVVIDGGRRIALKSSLDIGLRDQSDGPIVTVRGSETVAYLYRVSVRGNGDDVGIAVESGATLYADSVRVAQNFGGGITLAAGSSGFLRNCMVVGDGGNSSAIFSNGTLEVLFSTLGRNANFGEPVLECSGGAAMVRNSLIVNHTNTSGDEVSCAALTLENTEVKSTLTPENWFDGFFSGSCTLTAAGQTEFADVAIWETGDPPFDFEGDLRPNTDGASDYPGADTVP